MKRGLLLYTLVATALTASAQQKYDIKGVAPEGAKEVYVMKTRTDIDTFAVVGGNFAARGEYVAPGYAYIVTDKEANPPVRIPVIMTGQPFSVNLITKEATGSDINARLMNYERSISVYNDTLKLLIDEYNELRSKSEEEIKANMPGIESRYNSVKAGMCSYIVSVARDNTDNLIPALYLRDVADIIPDSIAISLFNPDYAYMKDENMQKLADYHHKKMRTAVGQPFTDFTLTDLSGKEAKLSDYAGRGKYVLVDFWASWCGPCIEEMPNVLKAYNKYKGKGFEIVGVSLDTKDANWRNAVKNMQMEWPQLSDLKGWRSSAGELYGIRAIPATVLISPEGTIISRDLRGEELEAKLSEIFDK